MIQTLNVIFLMLYLVIPIQTSNVFSSYYAMEIQSQEPIIKYQENKKIQPYDLTHLMSLLIILEEMKNANISLEDKILIQNETIQFNHQTLKLQEHDIVSMNDLLLSIIHVGAKEAIHATITYLNLTDDAFVDKMNDKAQQLYLKNTHFTNPYGYYDEQHYSSVKDLALITYSLIQENKQILDLIKIEEFYLDKIQPISLISNHLMLKQIEGCDGMKLSINNGQYDICAIQYHNGIRSIVVGVNGQNMQQIKQFFSELLQKIHQQYQSILLVKENEYSEDINVYQGNKQTVYYTHSALEYTVKKGQKVKIDQVQIHLNRLYAPIYKNQKIGTLNVFLSNKDQIEIYLYAQEDISHQSYYDLFITFLKKSFL